MQTINLDGVLFTTETLKGLDVNCHRLNLRDCSLFSAKTHILAEALSRGVCHTLDLSYNKIGDGLLSLATFRGHTLILNHCYIKDTKYISNFQGNTLELNNNCIGDKGAFYLATGKWHTLYLNKNLITYEGAKHLATATYKVLELNNNFIGDIGAKYISNFRGHSLSLNECSIGDNGATYLASCSFKYLSLVGNHIGNDGAIALSKMICDTLVIDKCYVCFKTCIIKNLCINEPPSKWQSVIQYIFGTIPEQANNNFNTYINYIKSQLVYLPIELIEIIVLYLMF